MYIGLHVKYLSNLDFSQQIFEKYSNIKFHFKKILSVGADGKTDRHDETDSRFSQFRERVQQEKACTPIDVTIPANGNVMQKGSGKEIEIQEFVYRDATNMEPEMYECTGNNWSHWNSNKKLKETSGSFTRKTFDRFTTKDSYTWNITHNTESTAV